MSACLTCFKFVVLACDGVWDVLTDQECIDIAAAEVFFFFFLRISFLYLFIPLGLPSAQDGPLLRGETRTRRGLLAEQR
jgi:hypothetical protein